MSLNKLFAALLLGVFAVSGAPGIAAASQVDTLLEKLVEKKILTRFDVEAIRADIETAEKQDFKAQIKSTNPWLEGLTSKGDVRLRYEAFNRETEDNRTATGDAGGTDRNRFRFRVRWGLEKKFNDEWKAGFRIASGAGTTDATSTNQTFDGEFGLKQVFIDQAYATYTPTARVKNWIAATDKVEIGMGKVANPYEKWGTTIIWDGDVTPEGIYEAWDFNLWNGESDASWKLHTLFGQWVVDEDSDNSPGDQEMQSYGVGTTYQWAKGHNVAFKTTYYDWNEYATFLKSSSALSNAMGGNDREVDAFRILNLYGELNFDAETIFWGKMPLKLFGDYAINTGLQDSAGTSTDVKDPALREDSDEAFSLGATLGKAKDPGQWAFTYEYLYIEPNAVVGNFAESDLGLGFANNRGHKLAWKYMVWKNLELNLTGWLVERIDPTRLTYGSAELRPAGDDDNILRTQADLVYKF